MQQRAIDKYSRLIAAGTRVIHERGYQKTGLADVARQAKVPQGSLYYYFKTKDDIAAAIMAERFNHLNELITKWNKLDTPQKRLHALINVWVDDRDIDSRYGCPIGSLCYELSKKQNALSEMAAEPLKLLVKWSEKQFGQMGKSRREAHDLALHLVSALQGVSLLANAFGSAQVILREAKQLKQWINEL